MLTRLPRCGTRDTNLWDPEGSIKSPFGEIRQTYPTKPGHFSRSLSKGPNTTTWIWNLHADAHDFDSHTSDLEEISRKVFSAHFGQLGVIFIWLSGCDTMMFRIQKCLISYF